MHLARYASLLLFCASSARAETVTLPPAEVEVGTPPALTESATGAAIAIELAPYAGRGVTLKDVLDHVPGITVRRFGGVGSFTSVSMRGLGAQNVNVVLDDLPLSVSSVGALDLSLYPIESLEAAEVYRGGGPIRFESPLAGVVRLKTRTPRDALRMSAHLGFGSELTRTGHVSAAGPAGDSGVRYSAFAGYEGTRGDYLFYDDRETLYTALDDKLTRRRNNRFDLGVARLSAEMDGPRRSIVRAAFHGAWRDQGVPGLGVQQATATHAREAQAVLRVAMNEAAFASDHVRVTLGADALMAGRDFTDPEREFGFQLGTRYRSTIAQAGVDARLQVMESLHHETELAPRLSYDTYRAPAFTAAAQPSRLARWHAGVGLEHRAELLLDLRAVVGARLDSIRDGERTHTRTSPRLGATYTLATCELRANGGQFHRFPTLLERYGTTPMSQNPALEPERGVIADVGARCKTPVGPVRSLVLDVSGFGSEVDGLIVFLPGFAGTVTAENLTKSRIVGFEASAVAAAWDLVGLDVSYTFTHARDRSGVLGFAGKSAPQIPVHDLSGRVSLGHVKAAIGYEASFTQGGFYDRANLRPIPRRLLHHADARLALLHSGFELKVAVQNLANTVSGAVPLRGAPGGVARMKLADFVQYPLPGRTWFVSLVWRDG